MRPRPDQPNKILVVRNDGLGDFILTLPLVAGLRNGFPHATIDALVSPVVAQLAPNLPDIHRMVIDPGVLLKRHRKIHTPQAAAEARKQLLEEIQQSAYDAVLFAYAEPASAALAHRARIPLRIGPLRRSFFWRFNRFMTASRKGSHRAEYELNLELLRCVGINPAEVDSTPTLALPESTIKLPKSPYVVMHPYKRSGTALTWPLTDFARVAAAWSAAGIQVVVIGDGEDEAILQKTFGGQHGGSNSGPVTLETGRSLPETLHLIGHAALFVGNSSGPLHLAGLAQVPHVGFFPQNRVSAPARWRTLPGKKAPADISSYLLSPDFSRDCVRCDGTRCPHFNCVSAITIQQLASAIQAWGLNELAEPLASLGK